MAPFFSRLGSLFAGFAVVAVFLTSAPVAAQTDAYDACADKAVGDACDIDGAPGECVGNENNCDGPLRDNQCVLCELDPVEEPEEEPLPANHVYQQCGSATAGAFCQLEDGGVGQCGDNFNNCGGDIGPCHFCAPIACNEAGEDCFLSTRGTCVENLVTCPGEAPCFVCDDDHSTPPQDPEGSKDDDSAGCATAATAPPAPGSLLLLAFLVAMRRRRG